jgi:DNA invertase Pin-like site-specific DNA recombinase
MANSNQTKGAEPMTNSKSTTPATFLYLRITDREQSTSQGEVQGRELANWCTKNQITNSEIFADHGASRLSDARPAFERMIAKIKAKECRILVVSSLSRIVRSKSELFTLLDAVKACETRLVSLHDGIDTHSTLSILTFLEALIKMEKDVLTERLQAGRKKTKVSSPPEQLAS